MDSALCAAVQGAVASPRDPSAPQRSPPRSYLPRAAGPVSPVPLTTLPGSRSAPQIDNRNPTPPAVAMHSLAAGPVPSTSYALPQAPARRGSARCALRQHRGRAAAVAAPQLEQPSQAEQVPLPHPHSISAITSTSHNGNSSSSSSPASLAGPGSASSRPMAVLTSALIAKAVDKAVEEVGAGLLAAARRARHNRTIAAGTPLNPAAAAHRAAQLVLPDFRPGGVPGRAGRLLGDGRPERVPRLGAAAMRAVRGRLPGAGPPAGTSGLVAWSCCSQPAGKHAR
jgi:hypothetical protein